jgi:2-iminobutanoate/2-iminopropanoate deaminase
VKQVIDAGLPVSKSPLEWATLADGILYTAQIPITANGQILDGDAAAQAEQTLDNLKQTVEAAGGTLDDITQVLIYVTGAEHLKPVNEVYARYFSAPYPHRAAMVISALARPEMVVEMIAYAHIGEPKKIGQQTSNQH